MVEEIKERVSRMDKGLHWYEIMTMEIEHTGEGKVMHPMNDYSNLFMMLVYWFPWC